MKILQSEPNDNIANSQLFQFKVKITKKTLKMIIKKC